MSLLISFIAYLIYCIYFSLCSSSCCINPINSNYLLMLIASIYFAKKENFAIDKKVKLQLVIYFLGHY